jgi:hypothetical protein
VNKLAVIVLLVGLAACSKKKPEEGREPAQTASPGAVVGSAAPAAPAPNPGAASGSTPTGSAAPAATGSTGGAATGGAARPASVGCATATTLACDAGQSDGCTGGLTTVHLCVAKDTKAGSPCAQQPAATCPAGQVDACLHDPPQSNNHVCVIVAKPTP